MGEGTGGLGGAGPGDGTGVRHAGSLGCVVQFTGAGCTNKSLSVPHSSSPNFHLSKLAMKESIERNSVFAVLQ